MSETSAVPVLCSRCGRDCGTHWHIIAGMSVCDWCLPQDLRAENERLRALGKEVSHDNGTLSQNNMDLRIRDAKLEKVAAAAIDLFGIDGKIDMRCAEDWRVDLFVALAELEAPDDSR